MKNLPVELIEKIHLRNTRCAAEWVWKADADLIDWDRVRFMHKSGQDDRGFTYDLIRYTCSDGTNRLLAVYQETDISGEDYAEWAAASCGLTYGAYIGRPWED